jgi:hypothetical protein
MYKNASTIEGSINGGNPVVMDIYTLEKNPKSGMLQGHAVLPDAYFVSDNLLNDNNPGSLNPVSKVHYFNIYDPDCPGQDNHYVWLYQNSNNNNTPVLEFIPVPEDIYLKLKVWALNDYPR